MNQVVIPHHVAGKSMATHTMSTRLLAVEGETFIFFNKDAKSLPFKTVGRLRGRKSFTSQKQAAQLIEWFNRLYPEEVSVKAVTDLPVVEISDLDLIALSKMGLAGQEMMNLAERLELTGKEIAKLLTLSQRTFHRRKPDELLDPVASERLLMLTKLADHGFDVFEDQHKFNRWLRRPLRILSDQTPLDILDTGQGINMVDTILGRIEYGIYS